MNLSCIEHQYSQPFSLTLCKAPHYQIEPLTHLLLLGYMLYITLQQIRHIKKNGMLLVDSISKVKGYRYMLSYDYFQSFSFFSRKKGAMSEIFPMTDFKMHDENLDYKFCTGGTAYFLQQVYIYHAA